MGGCFISNPYILYHTSNAKSNRSINITYIVSAIVTQFYQNLKHSFRAESRGVVYGGALQVEDFNREAQAVSRGEYERGGTSAHWRGVCGSSPGNFLKSKSLRMHSQAILKPFFPYSITSILSKVRHSNPPGGGGGTLIFSSIRRLGLFLGGSKF